MVRFAEGSLAAGAALESDFSRFAGSFASRATAGRPCIAAELFFPRMSDVLSIAFIGTGVMGRSMAGHLQKAGHRLHVYNRTRDKAQALLDAGATWHDTAGSAAAAADVVITMVGFPTDVEAVYLGAGGIVDRARPGAGALRHRPP